MNKFADVCSDIITRLERVTGAATAALAQLKCFERDIVYWPVAWIELRLKLVALKVSVEATKLCEEHHGKGVEYIMTAHDGKIFVTWIEDESVLTESRRSWEAPVTSLPTNQFNTFTTELLQQLMLGNWEPAVKWLQSHSLLVAPLKPI